MHLILRPEMPDQQRGGRVVLRHPALHQGRVRVRVAVAAQMPAGIVRADVPAQAAGALLPRGRSGRHVQAAMDGPFVHGDGHAAAAVRAEGAELVPLGAGAQGHAVLPGDAAPPGRSR